MKKIVFIGSGNVATHLGRALVASGVDVAQVWSRSLANAQVLAHDLGSHAVANISEVVDDADAYIFCVKDDALELCLDAFPHRDKLILHTAGSLSIDSLKPYSTKYGVLYPLQTFSKSKALDFKEVPILLEASDEQVLQGLTSLAEKISDKVSRATSDQRKYLHIAAVFACNFANHFYAIAENVLKDNGLDFNLLRPLILETAEKAMLHSPATVQTGPAVRKDTAIVDAHLTLLDADPQLQELYRLLSDKIMDRG